ncbi:MAG: ankyrin repeat domain-containing protein [Burkholderiales bacterium]|nr:ankyrin repeat domain-containing protein [Burkholderiales bacterium]
MISIGRTLLELQQKQARAERRALGDAPAIRARKDLADMGLTYHDKQQFLDAVRRGDLIAVRLFLTGRGVDPNAADVWGTSALDLAKRNGNPELVALLEGATRK